MAPKVKIDTKPTSIVRGLNRDQKISLATHLIEALSDSFPDTDKERALLAYAEEVRIRLYDLS